MSQKPILFGVGGLVVGSVFGFLLGGQASEGRVGAALERALAPSQEAEAEAASAQQEAMTAQQETLAAMQERLAALEEAMPEGGASAEDVQSAVSEQLAGFEESLSARLAELSEATQSQAENLRGSLDELASGLEQSARVAAAAVASNGGGGGGGATEGMEVTEPLTVGQTALFAEGGVRAFVSRINAQAGSVRLSINGETTEIGVGGAAPVSIEAGDCSVAVMGLESEGVTLGSDCSDAQPSGAMEGDAEAAGSAPPAPEEGFGVGEVAQLADGALRVFVSGMAQDGTAARIAVNGVTTQVVGSGESVEVQSGEQSCTVTVTGVGDGMVGLEGACG
ncbi:hypothetical protein [Salipiger mucosus]|uniref:Uncharacterized protein n=1 Tax=Salipiger mucosus DSM 16094 TaxID=1123237 RepID=S9Q9D7_9RHOB|nr:hypothetical protein [Salipiger mucosus]EPX76233.1 hypothetical protein Salmuc_04534 [Salipiger mucosus DSM 16094]